MKEEDIENILKANCVLVENETSFLLRVQEAHGFRLDVGFAIDMLDDLTKLCEESKNELKTIFPPKRVLRRSVCIKKTKKDETFKSILNLVSGEFEFEEYNPYSKKVEFFHSNLGNKSDLCNKFKDLICITNRTSDTKPKPPLKKGNIINIFDYEEFNPNSGTQIGERLKELGWTPTKFTEKGAPKTDKETLKEAIKTLLEQEDSNLFKDKQETNENLKRSLLLLKDFTILEDRRAKFEKWLKLYDKHDGRIHGRVRSIGATTHRCAHSEDNMANVPSVATSKFTLCNTEEIQNTLNNLKKFSKIPDNIFGDGSKRYFLNSSLDEKENKITIEAALGGIEGGFGWECRSCWCVDPGNVLVGVDASGIQLRALAHYINDPLYTEQILSGDIHEFNRKAAGIKDRATAKTFIYAWLLNAGDHLIGKICGVQDSEIKELIDYGKNTPHPYNPKKNLLQYACYWVERNLNLQRDKKDTLETFKKEVMFFVKGVKIKAQFLDSLPKLKEFRMKELPEATRRGYMRSLDGRKLWIPNEHLAPSLYLQGFEVCVMKVAMAIYQRTLRDYGIPFKQVAFVHDEFQIETPEKYGEVVGETCVASLKQAGEFLKTRCPIDGEYRIGLNWAQTH